MLKHMKIKNLRISHLFALAGMFCLFFFAVSCGESGNSGPFVITGIQTEGEFEVGQPMTAANVVVINYTGGGGAATVRAAAINGISIPERQINTGSGTLRIALSGTPIAVGSHSLLMEIRVDGSTRPANATFEVTQDGQGALPVVFSIDHETSFPLGNARMIPFALEPGCVATVTVVNPTGMIVSVAHNRPAGTGVITLTPRTDFAGGTFEVRATDPTRPTTTETLTLTSVPRSTAVGRRGVAMSMGVGHATYTSGANAGLRSGRGNITDNLYLLQPHWFWSWGPGLTPEQMELIPEGIEHVPAFWGGGSVNAENIARINELFEQGHIRYVRGFNEPDLSDQANMTVEVALIHWERLSRELHPDLRLISPAESWPRMGDNAWMVRFMQGVEERGLRMDYIAVHFYAEGLWPNQTVNHVRTVYQRWGRKVWLMETGVRYMPAGNNHAANNFTQAQIVTYMQELLPQLETMPELHRYSWFEPSNSHARLYRGRLIGCPPNGFYTPFTTCDEPVLTIVGQFYRSVNPNLNIRRRN